MPGVTAMSTDTPAQQAERVQIAGCGVRVGVLNRVALHDAKYCWEPCKLCECYAATDCHLASTASLGT